MLPYYSRSAVFGKEFKKLKHEEYKTNPGELLSCYYAHGGPVQRALCADLMMHYDKERYRECQDLSFHRFKQLFKKAKLALAHTWLCPTSKCDSDAYSQLVYASCLSLLENAFENHSEPSATLAVYAVYCLYAFYETNPLPESVSEKLELLAMSLQSRENPRQLYRRAFRQRIRINLQHYSYLTRLRDLQHYNADIVNVLDRLSGKLDFAAYSGPCNLEGLVGHHKYPYPESRSAYEQMCKQKSDTINPTATHTTEQEVVDLREVSFNGYLPELQASLDDYFKKRQAIRVPPQHPKMTNKAKRVRDALEPMFQQIEEHPVLSLLNQSTASKTRTVTFAPLVVTTEKPAFQQEGVHESELPDAMQTTNDAIELIKLNLPDAISEGLAQSIHDGIQTLIRRDPSLLFEKELGKEDISLLSTSVAATTVTGVGRQALQNLLEQATEQLPDQRKFLEFDEDKRSNEKPSVEEERFSDLSSSSEDNDEISMSASTIGRRALNELLEVATQKTKTIRSRPAPGKQKKSLAKRTFASPKKRRMTGATMIEPAAETSSSTSSCEDESDSSGSSEALHSIGHGGIALSVLLSHAMDG